MVALQGQYHPLLIEAVVSRAEQLASMVGQCLGPIHKKLQQQGLAGEQLELPVGYLLELGAIGQLCLWERQGLRTYLPADLPSYRDALNQLYERATQSPKELAAAAKAHLARRVLQVHVEQECWFASELLDANLALSRLEDDDAFIEAAAQLIWTLRHLDRQQQDK